MKLTIPRNTLHAALTQAARVVERRNTMPILANVRLATEAENWLRLTATDLDVEIRVRVAAAIERPGETTVPAALLSALVAKMNADWGVTLEALADNATLAVTAGRTKSRLQCLSPLDYPDISQIAPVCRFEMACADLVAAIEATQIAISTEETRYYLNGIFMHQSDDGRLALVATDGHRLARWRAPLPDGAAGMPGVIVPRKTVGELLKIAKHGEPGALAKLALSDTKLSVEIGDTVLVSKLIDGTFPDYGRVIPATHDAEVAIDRDDLEAAVGRVTTVNSERGRAVKLVFAGETLRLEVANPDAGSASEEIAARPTADAEPDLEIGFNGRYLGDMCTALAGDTIAARLPKDAGSPTIFVPVPEETDGRDRLVVLMPMRV